MLNAQSESSFSRVQKTTTKGVGSSHEDESLLKGHLRHSEAGGLITTFRFYLFGLNPRMSTKA